MTQNNNLDIKRHVKKIKDPSEDSRSVAMYLIGQSDEIEEEENKLIGRFNDENIKVEAYFEDGPGINKYPDQVGVFHPFDYI